MGKLAQIALIGGVILVGGSGILVMTNPTPAAYEDFAVDQIEAYAKREVCADSNSRVGGFLGGSCESLVGLGRGAARELVVRQTERRNYGLFSLYVTDLNVNEFLPTDLIGQSIPTYHIESVGIAGQFVIYKLQED